MNHIDVLRCAKCSAFKGYNEQHLPVVAFGKPDAPVTLLSLNPSYHEYTRGPSGEPPLFPLHKTTRVEASEDELKQTIRRQEEYFTTGHHYDWFNRAERFFNTLRTTEGEQLSFGLDGRRALVSNVDIVKCATNPTWRYLEEYQGMYALNCLPYLVQQIFAPSTKVVFLNGGGIEKLIRRLGKETGMFEASIEISRPVRMTHTLKDGSSSQLSSRYFMGNLDRNGIKVTVTGTSGRISEDYGPVFFNYDGTPARESEKLFSKIEQIIQDCLSPQ